jgi:hypothetical protein
MYSVWLDAELPSEFAIFEGARPSHSKYPQKAKRIALERAELLFRLQGMPFTGGHLVKSVRRFDLWEVLDTKNMSRRQAEKVIGRDLRKATDKNRPGNEIINVTEADINLILTA